MTRRSVHFTPGGEVRVTDQCEGTVILHPTSRLALQITDAVAEALMALDGETTYTLVDDDGDTWVYANGFWYCIGGADEEFWTGDEAVEGPTAFRGFESWRDILAVHGVQA